MSISLKSYHEELLSNRDRRISPSKKAHPDRESHQRRIIGTVVLDGVVAEAKYSNPETLIAASTKQGVCCFHLNGNDREGHKRILSYLLDNGLVRKAKSGKLYNISFKNDAETYAGKYKGSGFYGKIKLADFVDLETGEFI